MRYIVPRSTLVILAALPRLRHLRALLSLLVSSFLFRLWAAVLSRENNCLGAWRKLAYRMITNNYFLSQRVADGHNLLRELRDHLRVLRDQFLFVLSAAIKKCNTLSSFLHLCRASAAIPDLSRPSSARPNVDGSLF
jgi:hypothetical protein